MKTFFLLSLITAVNISVSAQIKGAQINIYNFSASANQYRLDCQITGMNTADGQNKSILCFIKNSSNMLTLVQVNNQNFAALINGNTTYPITLYTNNNTTGAFYFVLTAGNTDAVNKSLPLVDNEFYNIEDVLNVLYKSGVKPLTYKVFSGS